MRTALAAVFFGVAAASAAESIGVIRFDADVSRPSPYQARTVRGSTVTLEARLTAGGEPVALPSGAEAEFCWQTNGMDRLYWTTPAEAGTNGVLRAVWTPDMDPGASDVRFFFRAATSSGEADYSAHGGLRILPGPGETPGSIPLPAPVLDFAAVEIRNPPWPTNAVTAVDLAAATNAVALHGGFASENFAWIRAEPVFPEGGVTTNVVGDTLVTWRGAGAIPDRRLSVVSDNPEAETEGGSFEQVSGAEFGTLSNDLIRATGTPGPVGVRHAAESGRVISALVPMAPLARPECINDPEASVPGSQRELYEMVFTTPFSNVDTTRTLTYRHCLGSADGTWTAPLALQLYDTDDPDRVHPSACNPYFFFPDLADALRVQSVTRGDWYGCPPFIAVAPHVVIAPWHWTRGRGDTSTRFCFSRSPADFREVRFARPIREPAWVMGDTAFYITLDETPAQVYFLRSSDVFGRTGISTYMHGLPFFALNAHNCVVPVIAYTHTSGSNVPVPWRDRATMLSTDKAHLSPWLCLGYPNFPQLGHRAHKFDSGHGVYCFSPWGGITPDDAPVLVAHYTTSSRGPAYMSDETIAEIARIVETITGGEESIKIYGEAAE